MNPLASFPLNVSHSVALCTHPPVVRDETFTSHPSSSYPQVLSGRVTSHPLSTALSCAQSTLESRTFATRSRAPSESSSLSGIGPYQSLPILLEEVQVFDSQGATVDVLAFQKTTDEVRYHAQEVNVLPLFPNRPSTGVLSILGSGSSEQFGLLCATVAKKFTLLAFCPNPVLNSLQQVIIEYVNQQRVSLAGRAEVPNGLSVTVLVQYDTKLYGCTIGESGLFICNKDVVSDLLPADRLFTEPNDTRRADSLDGLHLSQPQHTDNKVSTVEIDILVQQGSVGSRNSALMIMHRMPKTSQPHARMAIVESVYRANRSPTKARSLFLHWYQQQEMQGSSMPPVAVQEHRLLDPQKYLQLSRLTTHYMPQTHGIRAPVSHPFTLRGMPNTALASTEERRSDYGDRLPDEEPVRSRAAALSPLPAATTSEIPRQDGYGQIAIDTPRALSRSSSNTDTTHRTPTSLSSRVSSSRSSSPTTSSAASETRSSQSVSSSRASSEALSTHTLDENLSQSSMPNSPSQTVLRELSVPPERAEAECLIPILDLDLAPSVPSTAPSPSGLRDSALYVGNRNVRLREPPALPDLVEGVLLFTKPSHPTAPGVPPLLSFLQSSRTVHPSREGNILPHVPASRMVQLPREESIPPYVPGSLRTFMQGKSPRIPDRALPPIGCSHYRASSTGLAFPHGVDDALTLWSGFLFPKYSRGPITTIDSGCPQSDVNHTLYRDIRIVNPESEGCAGSELVLPSTYQGGFLYVSTGSEEASDPLLHTMRDALRNIALHSPPDSIGTALSKLAIDYQARRQDLPDASPVRIGSGVHLGVARQTVKPLVLVLHREGNLYIFHNGANQLLWHRPDANVGISPFVRIAHHAGVSVVKLASQESDPSVAPPVAGNPNTSHYRGACLLILDQAISPGLETPLPPPFHGRGYDPRHRGPRQCISNLCAVHFPDNWSLRQP